MEDHLKSKINKDEKVYNWLPDFVYAGIDGAVTTFAVVAGVVGASLSATVILVLGFANIFADAFSMSTGKYMSDKSNREIYKKIEEVEFKHLEEKTEVEKEEVREILRKYGFKGKNLETATEIITSNPKGWVDLMMRNEFKMCHEGTHPMRGAVTTFVSFIAIGFIPLIAYTFNALLKFTPSALFITTCIATLSALFLVGAIKSKFSPKNWFLSGLETVLIGGTAAAIAYLVGVFIKYLIG